MAGKVGRFICIFVPMILTMITLIFLIMIGLGGTNSNNDYLSNIYFVRMNTTNATGNPDFAANPSNPSVPSSAVASNNSIVIQNYYTVALWGYCGGAGYSTSRSKLSFGQKSATAVDFCSTRALQYGFDPAQVWGIAPADQDEVLGKDFEKFINNTYLTTNRKWMSTLFILAVVATSIQILVGIGGLFSRLGSLFTTLSSLFTTGFIFAFAVVTTLTYTQMVYYSWEDLSDLGITMTVGATMLAYMWLAFVCSFIGGLFWAFSSCCCSGREHVPRKGSGATMAERVPYSYERVTDAPYGTTQTVNAERVGGFDASGYRHGQ